MEAVDAHLVGQASPGEARVSAGQIYDQRVLVPTYYDDRYNQGVAKVLGELGLDGVTIGELLDDGVLSVRGGHGSPSNDQRQGHVPYVKVSDIRALRINVNPTNLVSEAVARRHWRGVASGLQPWDVITPNRASSNIGEFAIMLPGEEAVVLTKEVFVFRVCDSNGIWNPFYLLWALSLRVVRDQWRRVALMQTNREDCGNRYREIILPRPASSEWATRVSSAFAAYFTTLATARDAFIEQLSADRFEYVANVRAVALVDAAGESGAEPSAEANDAE